MKKAISIIALALALTMMMSVAAFADDGFVVDPAVGTSGKVTATAAGDDINVVIANATTGAYYGVLLTGEVAEGSYPTVTTPIYYINQDEAPAGFTVKPIVPEETTPMTLFVSTNADEALVRIPVSYVVEPEVTGPAVTFMNGAETVAANLVTDADGNVTLPADVAFNKTVNTGYTFTLYSWVTADGKTEYLAGAKAAAATLEGVTLYAKYVTNIVIGDVTGDGKILVPDRTQIHQMVANKKPQGKVNKTYAELTGVADLEGVMGDVTGDGKILVPDRTQVHQMVANKKAQGKVGTSVYYVNK